MAITDGLAGAPASELDEMRQPINFDHCRSCGSSDDDDMDVDTGLTLCCDAEIVGECDPGCEHD